MVSIKSGHKDRRHQSEFGARLREARERAGLSIEELASKMSVGLSTAYCWEAGKRMPRNLLKLARTVRTSVGALYGERAA